MRPNYAEDRLSEADYLEGERDGQIRHELIGCHAYAMPGESDKHNKIGGNIFAEFRHVLKQRKSPCTAYINDMKVKVRNDFYYPDVMVVCDRQDLESDYYKTQPVIIVEVLSQGTRRNDKTLKRQSYLSLESLQEYVLVEQDKAEIEVFARQSGWQAAYYYQVDNEDISAFIQEKQQS